MSTRAKRNEIGKMTSCANIPRGEWSRFLGDFSRRHHGWLAELETYDFITREKVISPEMPLKSIELDLEDEKNPRINVNVQLDNKVIKNILFLPSLLTLLSFNDGGEALRIHTINTETTLRIQSPASHPGRG